MKVRQNASCGKSGKRIHGRLSPCIETPRTFLSGRLGHHPVSLASYFLTASGSNQCNRAAAGVGGAFHFIDGNRRPFDLRDRTISFPYHEDTVSGAVLIIISLIAPGAIVFFVSLILVPGPTVPKDTPKSLIWRRKIWEINTGWMGLGISLAGAFMVTEGLKKLYGKPRPDLIARCNPAVDNLSQFIVGGLYPNLEPMPLMVSHEICRQPDIKILRDGFASFPSGHSSFSFAGLLYLSFFLASKFSIYIPYLPATSPSDAFQSSHFSDYHRSRTNPSNDDSENSSSIPLRNRSAAPPLPALILVFAPIGACLFVTASRFFDNRHHGFDIISGSIIGIFFGWFGFRWYHLPVRQGSGWSWGARSRDRGFWTGVGTGGWVGHEGWTGSGKPSLDMEDGRNDDMLGSGQADKAELAQQRRQLRDYAPASQPPNGNYEMKNVPGNQGPQQGHDPRFSSGTASEWHAV